MKEPFLLSNNNLHLNKWENLLPGLTAGFTTRKGGISPKPFDSKNTGLHVNDREEYVLENRRRTAESIGFPVTSWTAAEQTHGDQIVKVSKPLAGSGSVSYADSIKKTDGFYTSEQGILLTMGFADCVPVYFLSKEKGLVGIVHAGWQGTAKNIAGKMVHLWRYMEGVHPGTIYAAIGPSIDSCCYTVDDRVIKALQETLPDHKPYNEVSEGQYALQLKEANYHLLINEGVPPEHIFVSSYCTSCNEDLFFSHRRDKGKTGRMTGFIGSLEK
ncbi:peptidoglycan editing factor PgeF [Alkalicoccus halolimnae]|uniref:Purine nucleoside phosphorylase n=1 Tax=Alkalicoccus halolimnae TaxID=1667239 RepID=A0A5C7FPB5_9BACI|nr:peptidoglycan editing factor PgeF [Alkalicoccus halolimnae]TXF86585.1 peptidoglycan editing factor PgeF [Alkalicoccus halolimnae]